MLRRLKANKKLLADVQKWIRIERLAFRVPQPDPLRNKVGRQVPTSERILQDFEDALKKIPYPWDRSHLRNTYSVLADRRALNLILSNDVMAHLRKRKYDYALDETDLALRQNALSPYSRKFHERMIRIVLRQLRETESLVSKAGLDEIWTQDFVTSAVDQLRKDLFVLYPFYPYLDKPGTSYREFVYQVHACFADCLKPSKARGTKSLALHLTAIFLTPPGLLKSGELNPTPDAVKKFLARKVRPAKDTGLYGELTDLKNGRIVPSILAKHS
jgi:hypothetical protein